jgi:hypothetical protein
VPSAAWWKAFYDRERSGIDLDALLDAAPVIPFPDGGALVFPHTRLSVSGPLVASVATAAARTRREVLALGVLHGGRERDAERVRSARAGDAAALRELRGVHDESGLASEEFSLDGFRALYERACRREGIVPRLRARFPFLVGEHPEDLPGLQELPRDAVLVGTADPIHHGVGYGTAEARDESSPSTSADARDRIGEQLGALSRGSFGDFARLCSRDLSDFRDVGPVLALLRPRAAWTLEDLALVDYSDVLAAARPTWVAAGRIRVQPR